MQTLSQNKSIAPKSALSGECKIRNTQKKNGPQKTPKPQNPGFVNRTPVGFPGPEKRGKEKSGNFAPCILDTGGREKGRRIKAQA